MAASEPLPSDRRWRPVRSHRSLRPGPVPPGARYVPAPPPPPPPVSEPEAEAPPAEEEPGRGRVVLDIQDLRTYFFTYDGIVRALEGINLQARAGETTGVVGETGCGKSVTAFSVARLVSEPGRVISGKILLNGVNLLWGLEKEARFKRIGTTGRVKVVRRYRQIRAANERMSSVRGRGIGMIFQEPTQSMNPVFSIADQLGESVMLHSGVEVLDALLGADRAAGGGGTTPGEAPVGDQPNGVPAIPAPDALTALGEGFEGALEKFVTVASKKTPEEVRSAAKAVAQAVGLPSLETELFYLARSAGPGARHLRRRALQAIGRVHLTRLQRNYIRHQRRLEALKRRQKQIGFFEMKRERLLQAARASVALKIRLSKIRHFYFGTFGIGRRASKPVKSELFWRVVELLEQVRIANPTQVARGYPHELSGGMLQRVMISMALSCEPALLLADEPTTALDVTIQAQILDLMRQLRERVGTAIVLITHDLGVVAEVCDHVNVMYAGVIVETGPVGEVFRRPLHPYTRGLLQSIPRFDQPDRRLETIPGSVPNLIRPPTGCRFHPRCPYAMPVCKEVRPELQLQGEEHRVACHLYGGEEAPAEPTEEGTLAEPVEAPLARPTA